MSDNKKPNNHEGNMPSFLEELLQHLGAPVMVVQVIPHFINPDDNEHTGNAEAAEPKEISIPIPSMFSEELIAFWADTLGPKTIATLMTDFLDEIGEDADGELVYDLTANDEGEPESKCACDDFEAGCGCDCDTPDDCLKHQRFLGAFETSVRNLLNAHIAMLDICNSYASTLADIDDVDAPATTDTKGSDPANG